MTDGACFPSQGIQNPTLTMLALTARASTTTTGTRVCESTEQKRRTTTCGCQVETLSSEQAQTGFRDGILAPESDNNRVVHSCIANARIDKAGHFHGNRNQRQIFYLERYGVERYAREVVQAIDAIFDTRPNVKVTVISPRLSQPPPQWKNITLCQAGHLHGHAWEQLELPWLSRGRLLFCPGNSAPILSLLSSQQVVYSTRSRLPYFPSAYSRAFRFWYGIVIPLALDRATAVITVSESERAAIRKRIPSRRSADFMLFRTAAYHPGSIYFLPVELKSDQGYVLYVGSLSKRKNFPGMLQAACRLARKEINFVFVGGSAGGIADYSMKVPDDVRSHFTFAGQIDDTVNLIQYYRRAACFLFPSYYEASPLPPIEAMACGCPVIASNIPSLRERCGDAAVYCNPTDIEDIVAAVEQVMDDPGVRTSLQTLGRKHSAKYTWERCATETLDVICSLA